MQGARRTQGIEPGGVLAEFGQKHAELAQGRGVILIGLGRQRDGLRQRLLRLGDVADQEQCFGMGGGAVIGRLEFVAAGLDALEQLARQRPRLIAAAGEQRQRRGVDQRIGGATDLAGPGVSAGGLAIEPPALRPLCGQRPCP